MELGELAIAILHAQFYLAVGCRAGAANLGNLVLEAAGRIDSSAVNITDQRGYRVWAAR